MYRHFLVQVDDSALSTANVTKAVSLAKEFGARITFFHAASDFGATDEAALPRSIELEEYLAAARGDTDSVLSKAIIPARAAGVPCRVATATSDHAGEAIVKAAQDNQCDLIVMASRGARGRATWFRGSQTERVLRRSNVATWPRRSRPW